MSDIVAILLLGWINPAALMRTSETVAGEPYTLFVHAHEATNNAAFEHQQAPRL
jgi:hypothetical protein